LGKDKVTKFLGLSNATLMLYESDALGAITSFRFGVLICPHIGGTNGSGGAVQ
jgi:hypothetical protein